MAILIDSREHYKENAEQRLRDMDIEAHIIKLDDYADYKLISARDIVGVQRKTIGEVLQQMREIQGRIKELRDAHTSAWLLVEEDNFRITNGMILHKRGKMLYETGVSIRSYYNFLHSIQRSGVYVKTVKDWNATIWWLYSLHEYVQGEHYPKLPRKYTQKEEIIGALMGVERIGEQSAKKIYRQLCRLNAVKSDVDSNASIDSKEVIDDGDMVQSTGISVDDTCICSKDPDNWKIVSKEMCEKCDRRDECDDYELAKSIEVTE